MTLLLVLAAAGCAPSFTEVRDDILVPSCAVGSSCHSVGAGGWTLSAEDAWEQLVDVESVNAPGEILVIPDDADGSYLIKKVEWADDIVGEGMPLGTTLDEDLTQDLRDWIDNGALED